MIPGLSPSSVTSATSSRTQPTHEELRLRVVNAVLAVAVGGLFYFLLGAPGRTAEARERQIQGLELEQQTLREQVASLRELTSRVQSATKASQDFATSNFLGRGNAFSTMIEDLEDMAVQAGLRPSNVGFELMDQSNELGWTGITVKLTLEGEYSDVVRFINGVEKSEIFWIIRSLNVAGDPATGLRLNITAETHLLPAQK